MAIWDEIRDRKITSTIAVVVLLVALVSIWAQTRSTTLKPNHSLLAGIGQVAAMETATAVRDNGQIVVVIDRSYTIDGAAQFDEWQAFQREVKKYKRINLLAPVIVEVDPNDGSPGCPSGIFKDLLEQYADVAAIVFFVSLPDFDWLRKNQRIPQRLPPHVIAVDTGPLPARGHYDSYFANGYVTMLIAARRSAAPVKPGGPQTGREWFDAYYQVFTPANFESLTE